MEPAASESDGVWKQISPLKEVTEEASSPRFSGSPALFEEVKEKKNTAGAEDDAYPEQVMVKDDCEVNGLKTQQQQKNNLDVEGGEEENSNPEVIVPQDAPE